MAIMKCRIWASPTPMEGASGTSTPGNVPPPPSKDLSWRCSMLNATGRHGQGERVKTPFHSARRASKGLFDRHGFCLNTDTADIDLGHSSVINHPNQDLAKNIGVCPAPPPTPSSRAGALS